MEDPGLNDLDRLQQPTNNTENDSIRGCTAILREKKKPKKAQNHQKKALFLQEKSTFLTQILNINEYFSNDYCEFS